MRIALIHALKHSIVPIEASFARLWPDATLMNLLDDSLSADLARDGRLTAGDDRPFPLARTLRGLHRRRRDPLHLLGLRPLHRGGRARARADAGAQAQRSDDRTGRRTRPPDRFALDLCPDADSMPAEFPRSVEVVPKLAEGALAALDRGDRAEHDRLVAEASRDLRDCDLIALAQYSMAPAAGWSPRPRACRSSRRRTARC